MVPFTKAERTPCAISSATWDSREAKSMEPSACMGVKGAAQRPVMVKGTMEGSM